MRQTFRGGRSLARRPRAAVPGERAALEEQEDGVEGVAEQAEQDDPGPHLGDRERPLGLQDEVADAVRARDHLADDHEDQRERQARAHAGEDLRRGGRKDDVAEAVARGDAVDEPRVDQRRVHAGDAVHGVEEDRPEADERDHEDLRVVADAEHEQCERQQRGGGDRAQELDDRLGRAPQDGRQAERDAAADTDPDGDDVADEQPDEARDDVASEPVEQPRVLERRQDVLEGRVVVDAAARRPHPDDGDDEQRHRDLDGHEERAAAHRTASRCDGCQRSTRASIFASTALRATPSRPVAIVSAYMRSGTPPARAWLISRPRPGAPITSSAVTTMTSAGALEMRMPVAMNGTAPGRLTLRRRSRRGMRNDWAVSRWTGSRSRTP